MKIRRLAKEFPESTADTFDAERYMSALQALTAFSDAVRDLDYETHAWIVNDLVTLTSSLVAIQKAVDEERAEQELTYWQAKR